MIRRTLPFAFVLALSACAGGAVPWENPAVPKSEWSRDWTACRRWAEAEIGYEDTSSAPFRDYDRSRAKRQADALAGACMQERGYVPARSKK